MKRLSKQRETHRHGNLEGAQEETTMVRTGAIC